MNHSISHIQAYGNIKKCFQNIFKLKKKTFLVRSKYTQQVVCSARENGYVETLAGRRRYVRDICETNNSRKRAKAERQAINTTIQGSAADIAKYAILRMERNLIRYGDKLDIPLGVINLVLHLHDELLYEVPSRNVKQILKILKSSMENCAKLSVPLKVKLKRGQCWGTMTEYQSA